MDAMEQGRTAAGEAGTGIGGGREARAPVGASEEQVREWLVAYVARLLDIDPHEVDAATPLERYGLDSAAAVALTGDLAKWLGIDLEPDLIRGRPTIDGVARQAVQELGRRQTPPAA
jgi:acyl carrier protein